jgi:hypothetical protein
MSDLSKPATRRGILLAAAVAAGAPLLAQPNSAKAGGVPQATAKYQLMPKGKSRCGLCNYFIPGAGSGPGQCKVVAGQISPNGWCQLFAPKHG